MSSTDPFSSVAASAASGSSASGAGSSTPKNQLGQDAFLKLMVAQLKNQNPLQPADPAQFLGQLAQFSTVSSVQNMQQSISSLADSLRSNQVLGGTTLVGHSILAAAQTADLGASDSITGAVQVPTGASSVQLSVTDTAGQLVKTINVSASPGLNAFAWDGTDSKGARAAAGTYQVQAIANVDGHSQQLETQLVGQVGSVTIDPSSSALTLNTTIGAVALANVRQVM